MNAVPLWQKGASYLVIGLGLVALASAPFLYCYSSKQRNEKERRIIYAHTVMEADRNQDSYITDCELVPNEEKRDCTVIYTEEDLVSLSLY